MIEKQSRWKSLSSMGCSCRWRSHLSYVTRRILLLKEQLVAPSQEIGQWHTTFEKTFWFETSIVYIKAFTPRSWRRTHRARSLLEVQTLEIGIKFFFYLVAMARFLVVCQRIQRKSRKMRQTKACDWSGQAGIDRTLAKTSEEWLSRIHVILLQLDRLQLTAVYCNRRGV